MFHRKFTRPRVRVYRAADRGLRWAWNHYDTATIGLGVVLPTLARRPGAWCVSLVWAKPVWAEPRKEPTMFDRILLFIAGVVLALLLAAWFGVLS